MNIKDYKKSLGLLTTAMNKKLSVRVLRNGVLVCMVLTSNSYAIVPIMQKVNLEKEVQNSQFDACKEFRLLDKKKYTRVGENAIAEYEKKCNVVVVPEQSLSADFKQMVGFYEKASEKRELVKKVIGKVRSNLEEGRKELDMLEKCFSLSIEKKSSDGFFVQNNCATIIANIKESIKTDLPKLRGQLAKAHEDWWKPEFFNRMTVGIDPTKKTDDYINAKMDLPIFLAGPKQKPLDKASEEYRAIKEENDEFFQKMKEDRQKQLDELDDYLIAQKAAGKDTTELAQVVDEIKGDKIGSKRGLAQRLAKTGYKMKDGKPFLSKVDYFKDKLTERNNKALDGYNDVLQKNLLLAYIAKENPSEREILNACLELKKNNISKTDSVDADIRKLGATAEGNVDEYTKYFTYKPLVNEVLSQSDNKKLCGVADSIVSYDTTLKYVEAGSILTATLASGVAMTGVLETLGLSAGLSGVAVDVMMGAGYYGLGVHGEKLAQRDVLNRVNEKGSVGSVSEVGSAKENTVFGAVTDASMGGLTSGAALRKPVVSLLKKGKLNVGGAVEETANKSLTLVGKNVDNAATSSAEHAIVASSVKTESKAADAVSSVAEDAPKKYNAKELAATRKAEWDEEKILKLFKEDPELEKHLKEVENSADLNKFIKETVLDADDQDEAFKILAVLKKKEPGISTKDLQKKFSDLLCKHCKKCKL